VSDPTTCADALAVLERYCVPVPAAVREALTRGEWESMKAGDARLAAAEYRIVARPQASLEAAARLAESRGVRAVILSDRLEGEARRVGGDMATLARRVIEDSDPCRPPCLLLSGGETTVEVRGHGCGGRNVEFLLSLAVALDGLPEVWAIAGDTDGVDGAEEVAGAIVAPDTLARAWRKDIRAVDRLADNDGHGFFAALGDQVITGPTLTNVNDFRAVLVAPGR
jgi:hydroxypyruvate reductase